MASKKAGVKGSAAGDSTPGARVVEKRFALKPGEQIEDMRVSFAIAPVGGKGPRPKTEVTLRFTVRPSSRPAHAQKTRKPTKRAFLAKATAIAGKAKRKRAGDAAPTPTPATPVGGVGRKPRVNQASNKSGTTG